MNSVLQKPKCLIVDDLPENIIALRSLLSDENVEVISAGSGPEALELLLQHHFALALLDVQMPEMDGFELAEIMRSTERTRSIPIIFVTAADTDTQRLFRGYETGAVDFLSKPLFAKIVISKVRIFLELFHQKQLLEEKIEKLKITEAFLNDALKSRDEFLSICSHELKTPLTSIKMQLQMHERKKTKQGEDAAFSKEYMKKFLHQSEQSVDRIIHLVNDMLDISRVSTGRLTLNLEPLDLSQLAKDVTDRMTPLLEMANNALTLEIKDPIMVRADRFRIEQVLTNLLTNVAKYAPEHPVKVQVQHNGHMASLKVADQGDGIQPHDQERIFKRFERAADSNLISGLGLGLYISKEIIEMHQGKISVMSEPGKGSIFEVNLPLMH